MALVAAVFVLACGAVWSDFERHLQRLRRRAGGVRCLQGIRLSADILELGLAGIHRALDQWRRHTWLGLDGGVDGKYQCPARF